MSDPTFVFLPSNHGRCRYTNLSRYQLTKAVKDGRIKAGKCGARLTFRVVDLVALVETSIENNDGLKHLEESK